LWRQSWDFATHTELARRIVGTNGAMTQKTERETAARWIVRQRKDGTRYWSGRLAWDEGKFEQETLTCNASDFPVGTVVICREPQVKHE
jgi:hypothetical protein